jgi:hypothetical protein
MLVPLFWLGAHAAPRRVAAVPAGPVFEAGHLLASLAAFALGGAVFGGFALVLGAAPRVRRSRAPLPVRPRR